MSDGKSHRPQYIRAAVWTVNCTLALVGITLGKHEDLSLGVLCLACLFSIVEMARD